MIEKTRIAYLVQIMKSWYEKDITTYDKIEKEIIRASAARDYQNRVLKAFGIVTKPTPTQVEYIKSWQEMGFTIEMLEIAYNKCMDNTNKLNFKYINTILTNWASKSISTPAQVNEEDSKFKSRKADTSRTKSTSYDLDEFEELGELEDPDPVFMPGVVDDNSLLTGITLEAYIPKPRQISVSTVEHGAVTADKTAACAGETVHLTAAPEDGYWLSAADNDVHVIQERGVGTVRNDTLMGDENMDLCLVTVSGGHLVYQGNRVDEGHVGIRAGAVNDLLSGGNSVEGHGMTVNFAEVLGNAVVAFKRVFGAHGHV